MTHRFSSCQTTKIGTQLSLRSEGIVKNLKNKENWEWAEDSQGYDIFPLNIDGSEYTVILTNQGFIKKSKEDNLSLPYISFLRGKYKTRDEVFEAQKETVLSFPLWYPAFEEHVEDPVVADLKEFYVLDEMAGHIFNPKFACLTINEVSSILNYILPEEYKGLTSEYQKEAKLNIERINTVLDLFKTSYQWLVDNPTKLDKYNDYDYPSFVLEDNEGATYLISSGDSHNYYVKMHNGVNSVWYVYSADYYQWDENDNPIHTQELYAPDILENPNAFLEWLNARPVNASWSENGATVDTMLSEDIQGAYLRFGMEVNIIKEQCGFEQKIYIENAEQLLTFDLGYKSKFDMFQWVFFGQSGLKWEDGKLLDADRIIPYEKLTKPLLSNDVRKISIEPAVLLSTNSRANILNIPKNIEPSFKELIKEAYEWLLSTDCNSLSKETLTALKEKMEAL